MEPVILKRNQVQRTDARRAVGGQNGPVEPEIRTLLQDGVIRAIEVVCACGETVTVELQLTSDRDTPPSPGDPA